MRPGHERHMDGPWVAGHMSAGGLILVILGIIVLVALLTVGIVFLVRYLRRSAPPSGQSVSTGQTDARLTPEQVLADRFAHGLIDEGEYTSRLAVLRR